MSREQARSVLDWISRVDSKEKNELSLAVGIGLDRSAVPGHWVGDGARVLGLTGACDLNVARRLFIHQCAPDGSMVASPKVERSFYSAVFDVEKTVSMLLAHPDPRVRQALKEAIERAAENAFALIESQARIRRGKNGVRSERPRGLTGLYFTHSASSAGDPHAHIHLMLLATAQGADGRWITLDGRQIFAQGMRMGVQEFQLTLYRELLQRLDLRELAPSFTRVGSTYMLRLSKLMPAVENLSSASKSMVSAWHQLSSHGVITGLSHRQHQIAWARHRRGKQELAEQLEHSLDEALSEDGDRATRLRKLWRNKMGETGAYLSEIRVREQPLENVVLHPISEAQFNALLTNLYTFNLADLANLIRFRFPEYGASESLVAAAQLVIEGTSCLASAELVLALQRYVEAMSKSVEADTATMVCVYGTSAKHKITTPRARDEEVQIKSRASALALKECTRIYPVVPTGATFEQARIIQMLAQGRALSLVSGVAGSGKTFVLRPITDGALRAHLGVTVLARNANLARDLGNELGVTSYSLAGFELAVKNQVHDLTKPQVIIIDEAGLVDRSDWRKLLSLAENHPIQIVAVGDRRQAQPIDGRATFAAITSALETSDAYGKLETTFRNKRWRNEANALRDGDGARVIEIARTERRIIAGQSSHRATTSSVGVDGTEVESARTGEDQLSSTEETLQRATEIYLERRRAREDIVVLARDNETVADVSSAIQEALGIEGIHEISKAQRAGIGDEVRTRMNLLALGVTNGDRFSVTGFTNAGVVLRRQANARSIILGYDYCKSWLELAYAATIDSVQGQTRDRVIAIVDDGIGSTQLYSAATRGTLPPIYLVKAGQEQCEALLEQAITHDDVALTVEELLAEEPSQSEDTGQRLTTEERGEVQADTKNDAPLVMPSLFSRRTRIVMQMAAALSSELSRVTETLNAANTQSPPSEPRDARATNSGSDQQRQLLEQLPDHPKRGDKLPTDLTSGETSPSTGSLDPSNAPGHREGAGNMRTGEELAENSEKILADQESLADPTDDQERSRYLSWLADDDLTSLNNQRWAADWWFYDNNTLPIEPTERVGPDDLAQNHREPPGEDPPAPRPTF
jgi:conjugative relaxase-like TrwC/TraI family protein